MPIYPVLFSNFSFQGKETLRCGGGRWEGPVKHFTYLVKLLCLQLLLLFRGQFGDAHLPATTPGSAQPSSLGSPRCGTVIVPPLPALGSRHRLPALLTVVPARPPIIPRNRILVDSAPAAMLGLSHLRHNAPYRFIVRGTGDETEESSPMKPATSSDTTAAVAAEMRTILLWNGDEGGGGGWRGGVAGC